MADVISTTNDSKWCRLLTAIAHLRLPVSYWRLRCDDREFQIPTPSPDLIVEHDGSRGIGDYMVPGPFLFRDVETVRWPASYSRDWFHGYPPAVEQQPLEELS